MNSNSKEIALATLLASLMHDLESAFNDVEEKWVAEIVGNAEWDTTPGAPGGVTIEATIEMLTELIGESLRWLFENSMPTEVAAPAALRVYIARQGWPLSIEEMLATDEWQMWEVQRQESMMTDNPTRWSRVELYARQGMDGNTHAEVIGDWLDFLNENPAQWPAGVVRHLLADAGSTTDWHRENHSLTQVIG